MQLRQPSHYNKIVEKRNGEWGMQVGSINEESQVRGCYNMICIYSNPVTVCRIPPESNTWVPMQAAAQTERPDSAWGRRAGYDTLWFRVVKLSPNQTTERNKGQKFMARDTHNALGYQINNPSHVEATVGRLGHLTLRAFHSQSR